MPPWLTQLSSVQRKESKSDSSRWLQLATIGIDNNHQEYLAEHFIIED